MVYLLMIGCGLRRGEVATLRLADLQKAGRTPGHRRLDRQSCAYANRASSGLGKVPVEGASLRRRMGTFWGDGLTPKGSWLLVRQNVRECYAMLRNVGAPCCLIFGQNGRLETVSDPNDRFDVLICVFYWFFSQSPKVHIDRWCEHQESRSRHNLSSVLHQ